MQRAKPNPGGKQYRKKIAALGLNQVQAGMFFRVSARTSRNWARDGAPEWIDMVIRVMGHCGLSVDDVNQLMADK